ncbi:hypothetical protein SDRG_00170 [Saprolegnia diclina VS20]|uniref:Calx-beta domain-containing protein n=1 Tax=Saprolegnia diclina (strain VS20) TaxID=1156394 RepID=T0R7K3_SAPDV|nr:hypothetical protein SDRG_00170 [Saprolegnia diclina VS20]EQC42435.1 hypothetical protein SDRG_00170 [Saprolegnia diclina VS20]|eukprot:XP_008603858.1 hypothetical protein SDRG_00170 [Saprolegnia diclina VS20]
MLRGGLARPAWRGIYVFVACVLAVAEASSTFGFAGGYTSASTAYPATCVGVCGSQTVSLVVQRTGDLSASQNVLVSTAPYIIPASSAAANVDYTPITSYALAFPAGAATQTLSVTVLTAGVNPTNVFFQVSLVGSTAGSTIDTSTTTSYVQIMGQAGVISFSMSNYSFSEAAGTVTIPVLRTGGSCGTVSVAYTLGNAMSTTAVRGTNYVMVDTNQVLMFTDGQTSASISVRIIDTHVFEYYSLFFTLQLVPPTVRGALGTFPSTYVFILDNNDAGVFVFSTEYTYCREDNGTAIVYINRTLGSSTSTVAPVQLTVTTTTAGNATQGSSRAFDYETKTQVFDWLSGDVQKAFAVTVFNNAAYNPVVRSVQVQLSAVSGGAAIGTTMDTTMIYIVDDRDAGTFSFRTSSYSVVENAAHVTLDVIRSGKPDPSGVNTYTSGVVSVDVVTNAGTVVPGLTVNDPLYDWGVVQARGCSHVSPCTATPGVHYTALPATTLTFQDGESAKQISITIADNSFFQAPNLVFKVVLQNVQGGAFLGLDLLYPTSFIPSLMASLDLSPADVPNFVSAIVTIADDGDAAVLLSKASLSVSEVGQTDVVSVVLNAAPTATVTLTLAGGTNQLVLSAGSITFTTANWNVPQAITISAVADTSTVGLNAIAVTFAATSSDARYSGPARLSIGASGVVYGAGIYTSPWGVYLSGNPQHAFPWVSTTSGLLTAPLAASVATYVFDANRAAIVLQPETSRHQWSKPTNFVCARAHGRVASVRLSLSSTPTANVVLSLATTAAGVTLTPASVTLTPAQWSSGASVNVAYTSSSAGLVVTGRVVVTSASTDSFYAGKTMAFYVSGYDAASITLNQTQGSYNENGPAVGQTDYTVRLTAEPMHWEPTFGLSQPHQVALSPIDDTSLSTFANPSATAPTLRVASNASESTAATSYQYVGLLRFSLASIAASTGSARVGLARLQLHRLSGGENGGLGGLQLGAVVATSATSWRAASLVTSCALGTCTVLDTSTASPTTRTDLLSAGVPFGNVAASRTLLAGLTDIAPKGALDPSSNQYVGGSGWLSLDVTTALNDLSTAGQTEMTIALYALRETTFVYGNIDEVTLASSKHANATLRPSLLLTSSGLVNVAASALASQSTPSANASAVLAPSAPAMSLLTGPAWWQANLGVMYALEAVVLSVRVLLPGVSTINVYLSSASLTTGVLPAVNTAAASFSRAFTVTTTTASESVALNWHVYGATGALDAAGIVYAPSLTSLVEAQFLTVQTTSTLYVTAVNVYQVPMAAARVTLGANLPSPSVLSASNVLRVSVDDPIESDNSPCNANDVCRNEVLFTSKSWSTPQTVHVAVANDNVASGPRTGAIAHLARSADVDYSAVAYGVCATTPASCTSPLQATMSVAIADDDEAGVLFTDGAVTVVEGARAYPGAPQPTVRGQWSPVTTPTCSAPRATNSATPCQGVFEPTPQLWTACTMANATLFGPSSAFVVVQLDAAKIASFGPPNDVTVTLPGNTVRTPSILSLWTSAQSTLDATLWTLVERVTVPFSASPAPIVFSGDALLVYIALWLETSYDVTAPTWMCADVASIAIHGDVPTSVETSDVSISQLSRMHQRGQPALLNVQLLSEPVVGVDVVVSTPSAYLTAFNPQNLSQNVGGVTYVTGGRYNAASYGAYLPTTLRFNASNWNRSQVLQIAAIDDNIYHGNQTLGITFTTVAADTTSVVPQSSLTPTAVGITSRPLPPSCRYASTPFVVSDGTQRAPAWPFHYVRSSTSAGSLTLTVALVDDDLPGVSVSVAPLIVVENASSVFNYSVVLDSQPTAPVTVAVTLTPTASSTRPNVAALTSAGTLSFDASNWWTPQFVVIAPSYIAGFEGVEASTVHYTLTIPKVDAGLLVTHVVTSADASYNGLPLASNDPTSVAAVAHGVSIVVEDIDTGCRGNFEYACANNHACATTLLGNRCNCTGVYGLRDCSAACTDAASCGFSRLSLLIRCDSAYAASAPCPGTLVPFNLLSPLYLLLNATRVVSADGSVYPALSNLPPMELGLYLAQATATTDPKSHSNAVRIVLDVLEPSGSSRPVQQKLLALFANGHLASLHVLSLDLVDVLPPSATSSIVLYAFVAFIALGGAAGGLLAVRYVRHPSVTGTKMHSLIVPQPLQTETHALIDHTEAVPS